MSADSGVMRLGKFLTYRCVCCGLAPTSCLALPGISLSLTNLSYGSFDEGDEVPLLLACNPIR